MRPPISAILAMCLLGAGAMAQTKQTSAPSGNDVVAPATGQHLSQTTGHEGPEGTKPAPHIYKKGDHLSSAYGEYQTVEDWEQRKLPAPSRGQHWVKYGTSFLLVDSTNGTISDIVKART